MKTSSNKLAGWDKPMLVFAVANLALAVFCLIAMVFDHRESLGVNVWLKPMKFAISIAIYSVTWSWLVSYLKPAMRRWTQIASSLALVALLAEMVAITWQASVGDRSHFNVATVFDSVLWAIMALSIIVLWVMTLVLSIGLWRTKIGDASITAAIRWGAITALIGMGLAFLMTSPTAQQLAHAGDGLTIIGAHTVGGEDGGPGLPVLGWSTEHGDLRVAHFIGMHALQLIPLFALLLKILGPRIPVLSSAVVRTRLVWIASGTYLAIVAITTWQALRAESFVKPSVLTIVVTAGVAVLALAATVGVLRAAPAAAEKPQPEEVHV